MLTIIPVFVSTLWWTTELPMGKDVYLHDYCDSYERFYEDELPPQETSQSRLAMKIDLMKTVNIAQRVWKL
jgi:hypothetical protein